MDSTHSSGESSQATRLKTGNSHDLHHATARNTSASSPPVRQLATEHTAEFPLDEQIIGENHHLALGLRAGLILAFVFQVSYLLADYRSALPQQRWPYLLGFNAFNAFVLLTAGALLSLARFRRHWRLICWTASAALIAGTTGIALITRSSDELGFLVLGLVSAAGFLIPWAAGWHASLSLLGIASLFGVEMWGLSSQVPIAVRWSILLASVAVAQFVIYQREGHRQKLREQFAALIATERKLRAEIAERETSERKVKERETLLQEIFDASPDVITIVSLETGKFSYINRNSGLSGYSKTELIGRSVFELGIWADTNRLENLFAQLKCGKTVHNYEFMLRRKDATLLPCVISATATRLGNEASVVAVVRDISALKRAQEANAFWAAVSSSCDVAIATVTPDLVYNGWNSAAERLYGYCAPEVLGKNLSFILAPGHEELIDDITRALKCGETIRDRELQCLRKDGQLIICSFTISPVYNETGVLLGYSALSHDVTALKRTEAELRASEEKFRQVFDSALDAIVVADLRTGVIIDTNAEFARRRGISRENAIGKTTTDLALWVRESDFVKFRESLRQFGCVRNQEALFRNQDGTLGICLLNSSKVKIGGRSCVVTVSRDISDLKAIERQLVETREAALAASKAKSEFLSAMSHEIRTPMTAIIGACDILSETSLNSEQRRYLDMMLSNANALLSLINSVLDLARIESGHLQLEDSDFELDQLIEETAQGLALRAHKKDLELAARIAPDVPLSLTGDPTRLRQVLVNLLGNAIKFTAKGQIVLSVEMADNEIQSAAFGPDQIASNGAGFTRELDRNAREIPDGTMAGRLALASYAVPNNETVPPNLAKWRTLPQQRDNEQVLLHFAVSDTGTGIPQDKLETIFADFTQLDSSSTRKNGGVGLGLAIARRLVELKGGRLWAESELGKGSTFHVILGFKTRIDAPHNRPPEKLKFAGSRVLVVDALPVNRLLVRDILEAEGARVEEARLGSAALAMVERAGEKGKPFHIVLLDARIPDMDGFELAQRLTSQAETIVGRCPVIIPMLSAHDLSAQLARVSELGIACYLVKPLKRAELRTVVAAVLKPALQVDTPGKPALAPAPGTTIRKQTAMQILLAEDSSDNRMIIKAYLAPKPYTLDMAENGKEAVEKFITAASTGNKYDLVLMDIQMPVMDGHTATRMIRQWEVKHGLGRTPILALTASAFAHDVRESLKAGCDGHIAKPIRKAALLEAIDSFSRREDNKSEDRHESIRAATELEGGTPTIAVHVNPALVSPVRTFLQRKRKDLAHMQQALERNDYETIRNLTRNISSEGSSLGLNAIGELGAHLESATLAGDVSSMRKWIAALSEYMAKVVLVDATVK